MTTGMEGLAQGASALAGQSAGLRAAVDNGQLVMDPERAEAVAKVYDDKADDIRRKRLRTDQLIARDAYGDCFIGRQLDQKFNEKVNSPDTGLVALLTKMESILKDMAQAYRDSARDMKNADEENARNLNV
ncbi:hypothetical protein [Saccharopolyspora flava]|uniref:Excreted virulence factor EspC, type VII ESX diderm n=1 Tax=Saccharopolyspora flava TaxID=95161 RepID=A0A1I6PU39_9PSEU|nr:hypothetical protein [Saccharopolyspora flava]SFS43747.1 hypothetical protein SAMN05660874_01110 [Saccharopolyspora flava]